jgi:hypothetical protein
MEENKFIILDDEETNDLTVYSYISNDLCVEYFVGYEITALLGYKNPSEVIKKNVCKNNQVEFRDYLGVKEPKFMINTIWGGSMYPANDNQEYNDAWTMPVGSECIKKIPTEYIIKGA